MSRFQGIYVIKVGYVVIVLNRTTAARYMNLLLREHQGLRVIIAFGRDISRARWNMYYVPCLYMTRLSETPC